nr:RHS repeat-associated core domain-containing protein [Thioflexithrix psekupsensis]
MGQVVESLSFDAWGRHRNAVDWSALSEAEISELIKSLEWRRGFTDHEHLNAVELIHMNGRIYDPIIGRFLSADPFVQSPNNLQSLNRYSYVLNNPLSYTDPSGYFSLKKLGKSIEKFVKQNWKSIVSIGVGIVVGALTAGIGTAIGLGALGGAILSGAGFGFASSFTGSMLSGRSFGDSLVAGLKGGVVGGITAGLTFGVGHVFFEGVSNSLLQFGLKTVAHGMVQGVSTMAQGGRFEHGFLAGMMGKVGGHFGLVGSVVAAGTAAEISGGKFVNGAVSGAFVYLFNDAVSEVWRLTGNFLTGTGHKREFFEEDSPLTRDLMQAPKVNAARGYFYKKNYLNNGQLESVTDYGGGFGPIEFFEATYPFKLFNLTRHFVGSYNVQIVPVEDKLQFTVTNVTSLESLLYHLPGVKSRESGWFGSITQVYTWEESIDKSRLGRIK